MRTGIARALDRYRRSFALFSPGQKVVAIVGTGALLLAAVMVFRWASAPSYAPLVARSRASLAVSTAITSTTPESDAET